MQEALDDPKWRKAMEEEYNALLKNNTWHLVSAMKGTNLIDCKWVYKIKKKADGTIDRYKGVELIMRIPLVVLLKLLRLDWFCL